MVHRWRQGKNRPSPETIEILARIGKENANLPREWGESFLSATHYFDAQKLINKLWGPKAIRQIPCNLPSRDRTDLIGRQFEIVRLLELLSPKHAAPLITVDGIGGVGKTALVLEVAYRCWKVSTDEELDQKVSPFDAIIFVSAKQQYLTPDGIILRNEAKRTLRDIIREIASTLNRLDITYLESQDRFSIVYKALGGQRTLLIIDNLETMEDKQEIMAFLYDLPPPVKVVITTRERIPSFPPIRLEQLSLNESLDLIQRESQEKEAGISEGQALKLYQRIGGIPAALIYAIGQVAGGYSVETVLERVPKADSDVARFCFEGSLGPLRGKAAHQLLMAMAMFPKPPIRGSLADTAGYKADPIVVEEGLAQLRKLSLVRENEGRYIMLPLTREYALSELAAHASFEQEARLRWVKWYLTYTQEFGGKDWEDWYIRYDRIDEEWENLLTIFEWCAIHEQYDTLQFFWQERQLVKFANVYGYWEDRLLWLDWLIQAAEKRSDRTNAVKAMVDLGSTLTLMGHFEDANRRFQRAWEIHKYSDRLVQLLLMQKMAFLNIRQNNYAKALDYLDQAKVLLDEIAPTLEKRELTRRQADFLSYRSLLFYVQRDYQHAEQAYREMLELAQSVDLQRVSFFAQNHLAYIAIAQDRLDEAEALLQMSLPVIKDKRLAAFHKHALAYFHQKMGDIDEAQRLAREAFDGFERLGMQQEAQEVGELLHLLQL